jgi:medium-chain acyl-[acyl-carrier-protein] hydrolase
MSVTTPKSPWFRSFNAGPTQRVAMVVFPYAGGGAAPFHSWLPYLPPWVALHLVLLPGREDRFFETPLSRGVEIVEKVSEAIGSTLEGPFLLFGHSMGSMLAFEVARQLRRIDSRGPSALIVSGRCAPQLISRTPRLAHLPGADLLRHVIQLYGGVPPEVLNDSELVEMMARVLKADLHVIETYQYADEEALPCPIAAYGGQTDPWVTQTELYAWHEQTRSVFTAAQYDGGHFYLRAAESERWLLEGVRQICEKVAAGDAPF